MEKLNIDGIHIAFERRGKGVPLVLMHGYPLDHTIWDEVISSLEGEFDLIVPDLRGFGESDVMEADDSIIDYATDIAGLLNWAEDQESLSCRPFHGRIRRTGLRP